MQALRLTVEKTMKKYLLAISGLFVLWTMAAHAQPSASANTHIIHVLKSQFERPNKPLEVPVVVVSGDYAVADWLQGDKGGRALLRRNADGWRVQMCSGAQFKSSQVLRQAGVQADDANQISRALKKNEQSLTHEQLKKIDSFQGIMDVLSNPEHHHH
jgi:hypothetical protein